MKKYVSFVCRKQKSNVNVHCQSCVIFMVESKFATCKSTDEYGFNGPLIVYIFVHEEALCNVRHIAHSLITP